MFAHLFAAPATPRCGFRRPRRTALMLPSTGRSRRSWREDRRRPGRTSCCMSSMPCARTSSASMDRRPGVSPFLDHLGTRSLVFRRAYAAASWTKPSVTTLLTSLYPATHAVGARHYADALPIDVPTLQSELAHAGYVTAQFSANPFTGPVSGLDRGFDRRIDGDGARSAERVRGAGRRPCTPSCSPGSPNIAHDQFFAYVHTVDTHPPFAGADEGARRDPESAYEAAIANVDRELGRLYADLERSGVLDNTVIVDHGRSRRGLRRARSAGPRTVGLRGRDSRAADRPRARAGPTAMDRRAGASRRSDADASRLAGVRGRAERPAGTQPHWRGRQRRPEAEPGRRHQVHVSGRRGRGRRPRRDARRRRLSVEAHCRRSARGAAHARARTGSTRIPAKRHDLSRTEPARARQLDRRARRFLRDQSTARATGSPAPTRACCSAPVPARDLVDQLRSLGYVR